MNGYEMLDLRIKNQDKRIEKKVRSTKLEVLMEDHRRKL